MVLVVSKTKEPIFNGNSICHNCWDLILNLSGTGVMTVGKQLLPFAPGTIFCVPPNMAHCKSSETGYTDVHVYATHFLNSVKVTQPMVFKDDSLQTIEHIFLQMNRLSIQWTTMRGELIEDFYRTALKYFALSFSAQEAHPLVQELTEAISAHFSDPAFRVNDLFVTCNYNEDYVRRVFKQYHGRTPSEYLTEIRLEHAKSLLQTNQFHVYTVAHIAFESGFSDPSYFSRVFRKHFRMTPLQYAKWIADQ